VNLCAVGLIRGDCLSLGRYSNRNCFVSWLFGSIDELAFVGVIINYVVFLEAEDVIIVHKRHFAFGAEKFFAVFVVEDIFA
jgi:hypothetical protein